MENNAGPLPTVSSDLDSFAAMTETTTKITTNKSKDQCEPAWHNIYDSHLHITEETVKVERIDEGSNEATDETVDSCNGDSKEIKLCEIKTEIKIEFSDEVDQTYNAEGDVSDDAYTIKSEPIDINDKQEQTDNRHFIYFKEEKAIKSESGVLENEENESQETITKKIDIGALKYENSTNKGLNISDPGNTSLQNVLKMLFICDICDEQFHSKSTLIRHILKKNYNHIISKHTKKISFKCPHCSYEAYYRGNLNRHINSVHTKSVIFKCSHCSFKTYQKGTLTKHINAKHKNKSGYNCSDCNFETRYKISLTRHVNAMHTKSTVFNCPYCSYKAYQKCNLTSHIKIQHPKLSKSRSPLK